MAEFYHPAKAQGRPVPAVLGLTASPVARSRSVGITELEQTLDAVCTIPTKHREELLAHVERPSLFCVPYLTSTQAVSENLQRLQQTIRGLDIMQDPYVKQLQMRDSQENRDKLRTVLETHETYIQKRMKSFHNKCYKIDQELGPLGCRLLHTRGCEAQHPRARKPRPGRGEVERGGEAVSDPSSCEALTLEPHLHHTWRSCRAKPASLSAPSPSTRAIPTASCLSRESGGRHRRAHAFRPPAHARQISSWLYGRHVEL